MKINFSKRLQGRDKLSRFIEEFEEPISRDYPEKHEIINFKYMTSKIKTELTDDIAKKFASNDLQIMEVERSGNNLWIPSPEPFALSLTRIRLPNGNDAHDIKTKDCEERGIKKRRRNMWTEGFGEIKIKQFREIPRVDIYGQAAFERLEGVEPTLVFRLLTDLGYNAEVTTTLEEIEKAIERAKASSSSSSYRSHNYHHSSGDGGMGFGTGLMIGAMFGGS